MTIPKRLRPYFEGRREVWRSLSTGDRAEAECRSVAWQAHGKRLFHTLQRHGDRMTKHQIDALIARWLEDALDEAEDERAMQGRISEAQREDSQLGLSELFDGAREALADGDYRTVIKEADELLRVAGLPALDHTSADFTRLCRRLLRAKVEYAQTEADRWDGEYRDEYLRSRSDKPEAAASLPFSDVMEKYLASSPRPPRTANPMRAEFLRFMETLGGDRPIGSISRADVVRYKERLQAKKQSPLTLIKYLSGLDALFKWAEVHAYTPAASPVKGLVPSKRQAKKQALKRQPFTDDELLLVLSSQEFLRQRMERSERYWLVLLLLFQICRREEAAQLYLKDIGEVDGVPFIQITADGKDQSLKNEGSKRRVPIHSSLIQLGFMQYVNSIRKARHQRLFPQLKSKGNNGYGDPVGKWFGRLVSSLGLTDPWLVIHSLRDGGITKLHSAAVPVNIVETLVGHSAGNVHQQYVHKELISMKTLRDGLEKLRYEEVLQALSHKG